jgi:hypothetical protein
MVRPNVDVRLYTRKTRRLQGQCSAGLGAGALRESEGMIVGTAGIYFRSDSSNAPYCVDAGRPSAYGVGKRFFIRSFRIARTACSAVDDSLVNESQRRVPA